MVSPKRPRPAADLALWVGARAHYDDAAYYTKAYRGREEDVAFYRALAAEHRGAVLEYGVGNGRLAEAMARAGCSVVGVDWSRPMLDDFRQRLSREEGAWARKIELVEGDMREVKIDQKFSLVVCAFNTFLHLYTRADVEAFLGKVKEHLTPKGRFVFDISLPQPGDLDRDPSKAYSAPRFKHPTTGQVVRYAERFDYDAARQILFISMEFTPVDGGEPWVVPLAHRQYFPQEVEALLHYNGLDVVDVRADFGDEPLGRYSDTGVWVTRPRRP